MGMLSTSPSWRRKSCSNCIPAVALVFVLSIGLSASAQSAPGIGTSLSGEFGNQADSTRGDITIRITIVDEKQQPLKQQSVVRITNQGNGRIFFQTTKSSSTAFNQLPPGKYLIEVGSAGFLGMHKEVDMGANRDLTETIALVRDPAAVSLTLKDPAQLPPKARKEAEKGLQALEFSNFLEARKRLEIANRMSPGNSSINFLLGYLALQQKDQAQELEYLTTAIKLDPNNLQAQNLLGQLYFRQDNYAKAAATEQIVVDGSPHSVVARKVLANSYLKLGKYEKARENAQWLVDNGGSEGASARLVLGQSLVSLQKYDEAVPVLKTYVEEQPTSPVSRQVRELIAELESVHAGPRAKLTGINDPDLAGDAPFAANAGIPLNVDAQKPQVASGVACPANIMKAMADPSKALVDSIAQFSAIEHMVHENLSTQGAPRNRETRDYNYVVAIAEPMPGILTVQEYRDAGDLEMPDKITTNGLAVLAIAFHPLFRDDFEMRCEGLGDWNGQAAWVVYFRQMEEKPSRLRTYVVGGNNYPVRLKGRAWVLADKMQVVHLETDLLRSVPEIRLDLEHTSVNYGPVQFKRGGSDLWLPTTADMYVHFGNRRFHRSESFDHYMLFAIDASDKAKVPKSSSDSPKPTNNSGPSISQ
jgi:tetratricopeptide (TPR) repeat protein